MTINMFKGPKRCTVEKEQIPMMQSAGWTIGGATSATSEQPATEQSENTESTQSTDTSEGSEDESAETEKPQKKPISRKIPVKK
jgi:hypothetical protein